MISDNNVLLKVLFGLEVHEVVCLVLEMGTTKTKTFNLGPPTVSR